LSSGSGLCLTHEAPNGGVELEAKMMTMIDLDSFITEAHKTSGLHINAFRAAIRVINERRGGGIYKDIKNGAMPMNHFLMLLEKFGA
jgi:hypothetical protein